MTTLRLWGADKNTALPEGMDFYETVEKDHGRIETRRYWQTEDIQWFADKKLWAGLKSVGMVESIREIGDDVSTERRLYMTSLDVNAKRFAQAVRRHWGVENTLHWSLDVTFGEDQSRARTKYAAQNLAMLRRNRLKPSKKRHIEKIARKEKKNGRRAGRYIPQNLDWYLDAFALRSGPGGNPFSIDEGEIVG